VRLLCVRRPHPADGPQASGAVRRPPVRSSGSLDVE
jgi:hypothetical protein